MSLLTFHAEDNMDIGVNSEVEYFIQSSELIWRVRWPYKWIDKWNIEQKIVIKEKLLLSTLVSPAVFHPGGQVKFQIDQTTGVLQTGSVGFDYEDSTDRFYTVIIVARDKGTNPMQQTVSKTMN